MPNVICDLTECRFNKNGICGNDEIEIAYDGLCQNCEEVKEKEEDKR